MADLLRYTIWSLFYVSSRRILNLLSYWNNINDSKEYKFIDDHSKIQSLIINSQLCLCSRS